MPEVLVGQGATGLDGDAEGADGRREAFAQGLKRGVGADDVAACAGQADQGLADQGGARCSWLAAAPISRLAWARVSISREASARATSMAISAASRRLAT
jgi:hypothetical protein